MTVSTRFMLAVAAMTSAVAAVPAEAQSFGAQTGGQGQDRTERADPRGYGRPEVSSQREKIGSYTTRGEVFFNDNHANVLSARCSGGDFQVFIPKLRESALDQSGQLRPDWDVSDVAGYDVIVFPAGRAFDTPWGNDAFNNRIERNAGILAEGSNLPSVGESREQREFRKRTGRNPSFIYKTEASEYGTIMNTIRTGATEYDQARALEQRPVRKNGPFGQRVVLSPRLCGG